MSVKEISQHGVRTVETFFTGQQLQILWNEDRRFQLHCGDGSVLRDGHPCNVEVKFEEKYTGNFFIETWSNRSIGRRGWMHHLSECNVLIYGFIDVGTFYEIDMPQLRRADLTRFREVPQTKNRQANDTFGLLVPITALAERRLIIRATRYTVSEAGFAFEELDLHAPVAADALARSQRKLAAYRWGL